MEPVGIPDRSQEEIVRSAIQQYLLDVRLGDVMDAGDTFFETLDDLLYYFLARGVQRQKLLQELQKLQAIQPDERNRARILHAIGKGKMFLGDTEGAADTFQQGCDTLLALPEGKSFRPFQVKLGQGERVTLTESTDAEIMILLELVHAQRLSGRLRDAEASARKALVLNRTRAERAAGSEDGNLYRVAEAVILYRLGMVLSVRGATDEAKDVYLRSLTFWKMAKISHFCGFLCACLAQQALWMMEFNRAGEWMEEATGWFNRDPDNPRSINTMTTFRLLGAIALERGRMDEASEYLDKSVSLARSGGRVEEELLGLVQLARLSSRQGNLEKGRSMLVRMKTSLQKSYPCFYADAFNVLASLERQAGDGEKAADAAAEAFKLAWCDGPSFAYHWGLETARHNLLELGRAVPELPEFDDSKFSPMPAKVLAAPATSPSPKRVLH